MKIKVIKTKNKYDKKNINEKNEKNVKNRKNKIIKQNNDKSYL